MKTACIYHSIDLDGWMSAAIVKHWFRLNHIQGFEEKGIEKCFHPKEESLEFIGYNYGQPILDLSEYDKVIMCDISFHFPVAFNLYEILGKNFIWIDHHISAIKEWINYENSSNIGEEGSITGIQDSSFAACELTWKYFFPNETMPEIVRLLGRYDCFGHKGTEEEQKVLEFQYGARSVISDYEQAYHQLSRELNELVGNTNTVQSIQSKGESIYQYLCTEAKQTYKNGFEIILHETIYFDSGTFIDKMTNGSYKERKFICINRERFNPVNFGIDYHKDGYDGAACFHYANGKWNFSLYNDNGLVDCSIIAKRFGGGGHKGAAGFVLDNEQFNKLISNNQ